MTPSCGVQAPQNSYGFYAVMQQNVGCYHTGACTYVDGSVAVIISTNPNWCQDLSKGVMKEGNVDTFGVMLGYQGPPNQAGFSAPDPNFNGVGTDAVDLFQIHRVPFTYEGDQVCGTSSYDEVPEPETTSALVNMTTAFDPNNPDLLIASFDASAYPQNNCPGQDPFKVTVKASPCAAMINTFPLESSGVNDTPGYYSGFACSP